MTSRKRNALFLALGAGAVLGTVFHGLRAQQEIPDRGDLSVGTVDDTRASTTPGVPSSTPASAVSKPADIPEPQPDPTQKREFVEPTERILLDVPFISQAPFRDWKDPRQQDGCEEASVIMVMNWVKGETMQPTEVLREILKLSLFQERTYGEFHDTSAKDTYEWLLREFYAYDNAELRYDIGREDIIQALADGHAVIVPIDGQKVGNAYYTAPGPERHMLVVIGYDPQKKEFITNDPGTGQGKQYHYPEKRFISSLRDYATGYHEPFGDHRTAMIVVKK